MKTCLFLFIAIFISTVSFAQEKLILGFDAGSLIAGEHMTSAPSGLTYTYKPDFLFGIEAGYGFSDEFALRVQLFIDERRVSSQQSFQIRDSGSSTLFTGTYSTGTKTEYFEIPITAKYNFFSGRSHGYIFAGPVVAFNIDEPASHSNFGIVGGAGYSRDLTHIITFFAETGYTVGLSNLSRDDAFKTFSRDFRINAGLLFNIALPIEY